MKKIRDGLSTLINVVKFCFKLTYTTSKKYFIIHIVIDIIAAIVPFIGIYCTSRMIDVLATNYSSGKSLGSSAVTAFIVFIIGAAIVEIAEKNLESLRNYVEGLYTDMIDVKAKQQIMEKAGTLKISYFDSPDFFDTLSDVNSNSTLIIMLSFQVFAFVKYFVQFAIAFFNVVVLNWYLPIIIVIAVIPSVIVNNKQMAAIYEFNLTNMKYDRKMTYLTELTVDRECAQDVRMFGLIPVIKRRFVETWGAMFKEKRGISLKYTRRLLLLDAIPLIFTALFLFMLGMDVFKGELSIGDFNLYQGLMSQVTGSVFMVIYSYSQIYDENMRISNYLKFIELDDGDDDDEGIDFTDKEFEVEFRNVSFKYADSEECDDECEEDYDETDEESDEEYEDDTDDEEDSGLVLDNVSFKINSKEKIALVGTNGSGKTSLVKLLLRFYEPTEGEILINGKDIRTYKKKSIRRHFSPMFQDYYNYAFTAGEDISLSDLQYENDEAKKLEAAKKSGAYDFIKDFPEGMDTFVTRQYEEGEELSGGQWQKIALARTFFRDAEMYILDEPSSALDAESEDELFRHFEELYKDKGALLISHRLSNVKNCDRIIVLDEGKICEEGTHTELMDADGKYAYMFNLQAEKYM